MTAALRSQTCQACWDANSKAIEALSVDLDLLIALRAELRDRTLALESYANRGGVYLRFVPDVPPLFHEVVVQVGIWGESDTEWIGVTAEDWARIPELREKRT